MECAAMMDALRVLTFVDERQHAEAADQLARLVAMLTKLCRSIVAVAVAVNDHVNGRPPFVMRLTCRRSATSCRAPWR